MPVRFAEAKIREEEPGSSPPLSVPGNSPQLVTPPARGWRSDRFFPMKVLKHMLQ